MRILLVHHVRLVGNLPLQLGDQIGRLLRIYTLPLVLNHTLGVALLAHSLLLLHQHLLPQPLLLELLLILCGCRWFTALPWIRWDRSLVDDVVHRYVRSMLSVLVISSGQSPLLRDVFRLGISLLLSHLVEVTHHTLATLLDDALVAVVGVVLIRVLIGCCLILEHSRSHHVVSGDSGVADVASLLHILHSNALVVGHVLLHVLHAHHVGIGHSSRVAIARVLLIEKVGLNHASSGMADHCST